MKTGKNTHRKAKKTLKKTEQKDDPPDRLLSYLDSKEGKRRVADRKAGFKDSLFDTLVLPFIVASFLYAFVV